MPLENLEFVKICNEGVAQNRLMEQKRTAEQEPNLPQKEDSAFIKIIYAICGVAGALVFWFMCVFFALMF